jgi:two-component system phosphate regulon sensor histidine kinase PhoR
MTIDPLVLVVGELVILACAAEIIRWHRRKLRDRTIKIDSLQRALRKAEIDQQLMQRRMTTLADASFDGLIVLDRQRHVTLINQAARVLFGIEGQFDRPLTLMEVTRDHLLDGLVARTLEATDALDDQFELEGRALKVHAERLGDGVVLALQDVTELLRLTRARRDMVANISHELRTPLSTIRLLVDTLNQKIDRNQPIDAKHLRKIAAETDSIQGLIQELHDLSMIESGRAIMRLIETPLITIVQDALNRTMAQIDKKKLTVVNTVDDQQHVLADPDQTRRVLTNLISNAVKFTPSGGTLTFSATSANGQVTVRVADTGIGIPVHERTRVFERFYQVDNARSGTHGSSGLGLSIAKHIVEAQGGKIWVEGVELQGACLCFTLTAISPQPKMQESIEAVKPA